MYLNVLVVCFILILANHTSNQLKGKITGLPTLPHESMMLEYKPKIENLKFQILKDAEDFQKLVTMVQGLIQKNALTSKSVAGAKIQAAKKMIAEAKEEAKYSPLSVRMCVNRQDLEIPKLYTPPPMHCYVNYTDMINVKGKLLKMHHVVSTLYHHCHQIYMEDNERDINLFKTCLNGRVLDVNLNVLKIKEEFNAAVSNVINSSVQCLIQGNYEVFKSIGEIVNALKICKHATCIHNQRMK